MNQKKPYQYPISPEQAFLAADREARERAGLTNQAGTYHFICPNCGSPCKGQWVWDEAHTYLHGHTCCTKCSIHLVV